MKRRTATKTTTRKLTLQMLQQRQLMAGDVTVQVSAGDLVVYGDSQSNNISVYQKQLGSSTWYVDGGYKAGFDTTVNGRKGAQIFRGVVDDIRIYTNDGSDWINIQNGRVRDELYVRTGNGNDGIYMTNVSTGRDVNVNLGGQPSQSLQDYIFMQDVIAGDDILVDGSQGRDIVILDDVIANDLIRVRTGDGNDSVKLSRSNADRFYGYLGAGNDQARLEMNELRRTHVSGGYGFDSLSLGGRAGRLGYFTTSSIT